MSVNATEGVTNGFLASATASGADVAQTQDDAQMFLQLMVAQLKYQNPLSPTDSTQFLTQQAQFTQLQTVQAIQDEMSQMMSTQLAFGATSMIGKQVSWTADDGTTHSGVVQAASFQSTGPVLSVDGTDVPLFNVTDVTDVPAGPTAPTTA
jgi:flagellar basal-body rod modification protein FlgD